MAEKKLVARLQDEIDAMLRIAFHMRVAFENELNDGMGHKMLAIPDKLVKKGQELAKMVDTMTSAKIRYDKSAKKLSDDMTPEEEEAAVITYIKTRDPSDRSRIMSLIQGWRRDHGELHASPSLPPQ